MLPLPPRGAGSGWVNRVRLGRDYYVRVDRNDYSVDPAVIGRFVDVTADLARVEVRPRRDAWSPPMTGSGHARMTITDPAHVAAAKALREQFQPAHRPAARSTRGLVRDLADYDRAFGVDSTARRHHFRR